ncbi:AAA family ATPase [Methylomonas sp. AM2-LC]|uniref:AAA family ATPase n=1 Tax=Methylomonas sp. AM2-LC TaxID=3153301 RepID=UPI003263E86B
MSRYCAEHDSGPILEAAEIWKERCLVKQLSVFTESPVWTTEHIAELEQYFSNNLDEGEGNFFEKMENQIQETSPSAKQLAAEMLWIIFLCPSNIGPEKKREGVQRIWNWSDSVIPDHHPLLSDATFRGIGSAGTSFNINRWRELIFFINVMKAFLALPQDKRYSLLKHADDFGVWIASIPEAEKRQLRHMLLFLLFPDSFERIFGGSDREAIVVAFSGLPKNTAHKLSAYVLDQKLSEIRQQQVAEYRTEELDFYHTPLIEQWKESEQKSYLFSWNPEKLTWDSFAADRFKTQSGESVIMSWRCANTQIKLGDRAYLLRTGIEPKGIIAAGNIVKEPYQDLHFDEAKAAKGEEVFYVDIEFTQIVDPTIDPFIALNELNQITLDNQQWNPQSSGIEIKKRSAGKVEQLWQDIRHKAVERLPVEPTKTSKPINLILYGPPGTGKTYTLNTEYVKKYQQKPEAISDDEWMESIIGELSWWEVVFAALYEIGGNKAKVNAIATHPYVLAKAKILGRSKYISNQIWASLQSHTSENSVTVQYAKRTAPFVFDKTEDAQWTLVGEWQEEGAEIIQAVERIKKGAGAADKPINRYEFITFHQAFAYEDFVEGIRPQETDQGSGDIIYKVQPGVFRRICELAKNDPEHRYAIFIDEINRGNIAKILGELITLIEVDKRAEYSRDGVLQSGMELTLPYSGDKFGVPKNLDIIATMNTADRSIALLDTALRRRFTFRELMPQSGVISGTNSDGSIPDGQGGAINLRALLDTMNKRIRFLLHRDQTIGHAYFTSVRDFNTLKQVFLNQIIPLLQEYFYEDWHRIQLVLRDVGPNRSPVEPQIIGHKTVNDTDVLGFDHDDYEDSIEYWVVDEDELVPDAIRKIYELS